MRPWQQSDDPYLRFAEWEEWTRGQLPEEVCKEFDESSLSLQLQLYNLFCEVADQQKRELKNERRDSTCNRCKGKGELRSQGAIVVCDCQWE